MRKKLCCLLAILLCATLLTVSCGQDEAPSAPVATDTASSPDGTGNATEIPTDAPTDAPTEKPVEVPTEVPTEAPTTAPTETPTEAPTEAPTEPVPDNDPSLYEYEVLPAGDIRITKYIGGRANAEIPSHIGDRKVMDIGQEAFRDCIGLVSVTIPEGVTSIGDRAFYGCTALTSVTIPNGVISIGSAAFSGCAGLTSLTISEGVTSIGKDAFAGCTGLTSVTIPDDMTSILKESFYDTPWYRNQPDDPSLYRYEVLSTGDVEITKYRGGRTTAVIPALIDNRKVTSIGQEAFLGCTGLTSIEIPSSVTSIGEGAFAWCTGLTSITIPDSVRSIGKDAFADTAWYDHQPDGLVYAGKVAYKYKGIMPNEASITFRKGTRGIADFAFEGCEIRFSFEDNRRPSITIPDSVTSIGRGAFSDFVCFTSITVDTANQAYESKGQCLIERATGILVLGCENSVIPADGCVTSIGAYAFNDCWRLTSITIPDSVTSIGDFAFEGCTGLTSITIPSSVTSIGDSAFYGWNRFKTIYIAKGTNTSTWSRGWHWQCYAIIVYK